MQRHLSVRYTEVVSKRDVGYAASIQYCPVILQAYVPKRLELRITVVGQQVFAAEIHSQQTHHTRHDWRRYDFGRTPHFRTTCRRKCRSVASGWSSGWGCAMAPST